MSNGIYLHNTAILNATQKDLSLHVTKGLTSESTDNPNEIITYHIAPSKNDDVHVDPLITGKLITVNRPDIGNVKAQRDQPLDFIERPDTQEPITVGEGQPLTFIVDPKDNKLIASFVDAGGVKRDIKFVDA